MPNQTAQDGWCVYIVFFGAAHDISNNINYNHLILSWASNVASSITLHTMWPALLPFRKGPQVVVLFFAKGRFALGFLRANLQVATTTRA